MPKISITYFDIEGAAEKLRLACVQNDIEFEDHRIAFADWPALKPKTVYGQVPLMTIDGKEVAQSPAMLRWIARQGDSSLYPRDIDKEFAIEETIALSDDLAKAWMPAMYMGMRPTAFGYPADMPKADQDALVKKLRESFLADTLPRFMRYFTEKLNATGAFLCGDSVTIADLQVLPQLRYYTKGVADHVPADTLKSYPVVTAWIDRMMALPKIKSWYAVKPKSLKLSYFAGRGLGEVCRTALVVAGVKFEDKKYPFTITEGDGPVYGRLSKPEMEADQAAGLFAANLGRLPILEADGVRIGGTEPILRYICTTYGLYGANNVEAAQIDTICDVIGDIKESFGKQEDKALWFTSEDSTQGKRCLPFYLRGLEPLLGDGYAVGGKFSKADCVIYRSFGECANTKGVFGPP
eukprot:368147_1